MFRLLLFMALFYCYGSRSNAEVFTALSDVEPLLETHKRVVDDLDSYIRNEEERLRTIKRHLNQFTHEHEKAMKDVPNYLGNPINAFTIIKRLSIDLDFITERIKLGTEYLKNITMKHEGLRYPTVDDVTGAAQALTRLQETYLLNVHQLSEGILDDDRNSTPMTASDCYEMGRALYDMKDYKNALAWMTEAYRKVIRNEDAYFFKEIDVVEYIAYIYYLLGELKPALEWTYKILKLDPNHTRALDNLPVFKKGAEEEVEKKEHQDNDLKQNNEGKVEWIEAPDGEWQFSHEREIPNYRALCRGEIKVSPDVSKRLKCWYISEHHPFLKYAPIKVEQTYIQPNIFIFHEVLSDSEIETIQSLARPGFKRALVFDQKTGESKAAIYRIGKLSWLRDEASPVVARLTRRVADMTGLDTSWAEELQVVNYGIGGHYDAHFDFARNNDIYNFDGNRLATVLFYMSDVAQGGATVFTELGLSLFPIKGAAAFWLNLHPSGEGDIATRHAACPVLRGSKWVCNKWIKLVGQELIKPCGLEYQTEGIRRKLPQPVPRTSRSR